MTISERVNQIIMASIHYRNRQLVFRWVMSEHNRHKYISAAQDLEQKKSALLTAISNGAYIK